MRHTSASAILAAGQRTIEIEQSALGDLQTSLGPAFVDVVELCAGIPGRVILTGVGKSGHVARKISATLASTGTPSLYVHPTEASHGDLGMITRQDVVIALSRSGETKELSDILAYTARFSIPLVALTAKAQSALGQAASHLLLIPDAPEACAETKAPTTSTTLSMALGDALAVAMLEVRGFTGEDFKVFHPGGKLGAMLLRVGDLMSAGDALPVADEGAALSEGLAVMSSGGLGCLAVIDAEGALAGMLTDGDLRRLLASGAVPETLGEAMTRDPVTVAPDTLASKALSLMNARRITQLIAVEQGRPVGILHMHELLKAGLA
ncbi:MAG: KpsF/GutQ family sugar-phosphate isomerase [Pseudomonadota bacterium]